MSRVVLVLGAGGHARVLVDALLQLGGQAIRGLIDPAFAAGTKGPFELPILGGDEVVFRTAPDEILLINGIGSTQIMAKRDTIFQRFSKRGYTFADVVHPSAILSRAAVLEEGAQVMAGAVVQCGTTIGRNSIVNTRASVDHDCQIGRTVHISPGATLSGAVSVADRTHIGTGAVVIQGVSIGSDSLIAAGTVVHRDVPPGSRIIGR